MLIHLDPDHLRSTMSQWRDSVDFRIPLADDIKLCLMSQRLDILKNFATTSFAWLQILRGALPLVEGRPEFDRLLADIEEFRAWALSEITKLDAVALQEAVDQGIDEVAMNPEFRAAIEELGRRIKRDQGKAPG